MEGFQIEGGKRQFAIYFWEMVRGFLVGLKFVAFAWMECHMGPVGGNGVRLRYKMSAPPPDAAGAVAKAQASCRLSGAGCRVATECWCCGGFRSWEVVVN
jgi:hypothetical protein